MLHSLSGRIVRLLERRGLLIADPEHPLLDFEAHSSFAHLQAASIQYRIAIGPQAGRKARADRHAGKASCTSYRHSRSAPSPTAKPHSLHRRLCAQTAICRVHSGWVVLGDVQFLRGYSLILPDPVVSHLNELGAAGRKTLFYEASVVGDALLEITGAVRINYEILGNLEPALHLHIFPRFLDEPVELSTRPPWFYDWDRAPAFDPRRDASLMSAIRTRLEETDIVP